MPLQAAHDLSNCLAPARGYVDMARKHPDLPSQIREWLDRAHDCLEDAFHCVNLIRGIAETAEVIVGPHDFDVNTVALRVHRDFEAHLQKLGVCLYLDQAPESLPVRGDGFACQRAIQNLVMNARDAILRAGRGEDGKGKIAIATGKCSGRAILTVSDNGTGFSGQIPAAEIAGEVVPEQHGLGLRVVRRSMDALSGEVDCVSFLGKGSRFTLSLPIPEVSKCNVTLLTSATPPESLPAA
jgi:signal transduction histidine kinase